MHACYTEHTLGMKYALSYICSVAPPVGTVACHSLFLGVCGLDYWTGKLTLCDLTLYT